MDNDARIADGPRVLLAENDVAVNALLADVLTGRGLRCESVYDGAAALQRLRDGGIDVLVTDLDMPQLPGEELLEQLATLDDAPRTVVISGFIDAEVEKRLRAVPAVREVLRKPFDVIRFARLVQDLAAEPAATRRGATGRGATGRGAAEESG